MNRYILVVIGLYCLVAQAQHIAIDNPVRFLALGDSYTIGQNVPVNQRWPVQFRDSMAARGYQFDTLSIIATTGWTTTNLLNAIDNQNLDQKNYNLVSVLIGVNNQYQGQNISFYDDHFSALLDSAIRYANGDTHRVFVVSIPDYAYTPFGQAGGTQNAQNISTEIDQYNHINDSISSVYGIKYFNITPISRQGLIDPNLVANDGLHPSGEQYSLWVELMMACIDDQALSTLEIENSLTIYPNPTSRQLQIDGINGNFNQLRLYSLSGRLVKTMNLAGVNTTVVDCDGVSSGTYIVNLLNTKNKLSISRSIILE